MNYTQDHNFILCNADTDSISFCKNDMSSFSEEEQEQLLNEINSLLPEKIIFEHDGVFETVVVLKAKNYILYDGKKIKIKGSALKASTKEAALKEMINRFVEVLVKEGLNNDRLVNIYHEYIIEAREIRDIMRWSSRKTITDSVLNPERTNEQKVFDALEGEEIQQGDRRYFYFKEDNSLGLAEQFDGNYNRTKLYEKIWKTANIFETVVDKSLFTKYHLKRSKELINNL